MIIELLTGTDINEDRYRKRFFRKIAEIIKVQQMKTACICLPSATDAVNASPRYFPPGILFKIPSAENPSTLKMMDISGASIVREKTDSSEAITANDI
jgi:hypothetical protein